MKYKKLKHLRDYKNLIQAKRRGDKKMYITAKECHKMAMEKRKQIKEDNLQEKWGMLSFEILEAIWSMIKNGSEIIYLDEYFIDPETKVYLEELGYKIKEYDRWDNVNNKRENGTIIQCITNNNNY